MWPSLAAYIGNQFFMCEAPQLPLFGSYKVTQATSKMVECHMLHSAFHVLHWLVRSCLPGSTIFLGVCGSQSVLTKWPRLSTQNSVRIGECMPRQSSNLADHVLYRPMDTVAWHPVTFFVCLCRLLRLAWRVCGANKRETSLISLKSFLWKYTSVTFSAWADAYSNTKVHAVWLFVLCLDNFCTFSCFLSFYVFVHQRPLA